MDEWRLIKDKLKNVQLIFCSMPLEDKARILITEKCNRRCSGCCNTYPYIMSHAKYINDLMDLPKELGEIMITGG